LERSLYTTQMTPSIIWRYGVQPVVVNELESTPVETSWSKVGYAFSGISLLNLNPILYSTRYLLRRKNTGFYPFHRGSPTTYHVRERRKDKGTYQSHL